VKTERYRFGTDEGKTRHRDEEDTEKEKHMREEDLGVLHGYGKLDSKIGLRRIANREIS
jgi:hypothetical protein